MKYKIIIFDLDDTLIDNKKNVEAAFKAMAEAYGLPFSVAAFDRWYTIDKQFWLDWQDGRIVVPPHLRHETGKKSDEYLDWVRSRRVIQYFGKEISETQAVKLNNIYLNALNHMVLPIEGARGVLEYLSSRYKIIIATNGPKTAVEQKLRSIECLPFVTDALSADMFGFMKPKIEFFEAIEKRYRDFSREDYLIVGDSLKSDVGFGMNAGIDSCWFNKNNETLYSAYTPTFIITELSELKNIL